MGKVGQYNLTDTFTNTQTGYTDTLELWLAIAETKLNQFDNRTAEALVLADIWDKTLIPTK